MGRLAQLGERHVYTVEVGGSIPSPPTSRLAELSSRPARAILLDTVKPVAVHGSIFLVRGCSSVWLERRPVTPEVASSSLVTPAT